MPRTTKSNKKEMTLLQAIELIRHCDNERLEGSRSMKNGF